MNSIDIIQQALTPGSVLNPKNLVFRSAHTLAQFAGLSYNDTVSLIIDNLADRVTIKPSNKNPEKGPLVALNEVLDAYEPQVELKINLEDKPVKMTPAEAEILKLPEDEFQKIIEKYTTPKKKYLDALNKFPPDEKANGLVKLKEKKNPGPPAGFFKEVKLDDPIAQEAFISVADKEEEEDDF